MIKEATCFTKNAALSAIFAKHSVIFGFKFLYRSQFCQLPVLHPICLLGGPARVETASDFLLKAHAEAGCRRAGRLCSAGAGAAWGRMVSDCGPNGGLAVHRLRREVLGVVEERI